MSTNFMQNLPEKKMSNKQLKELADLCKELKATRKTIISKEDELKEIKATELKLSSETIPDLLQCIGLSAVSLDTGENIEIKEDLKISLPKKDLNKRDKYFEFIEQNQGEGIIKSSITFFAPSSNFMHKLDSWGISYEREFDIHPATLKAFFKELLGMKKNCIQKIQLDDLPEEIKIFIYKKTVIS